MSDRASDADRDEGQAKPVDRRDFLRAAGAGAALAAGAGAAEASQAPAAQPGGPPVTPARPYLTTPANFVDVSRGDPRPHTLTGDALVQARLTPATWRLEIGTDG